MYPSNFNEIGGIFVHQQVKELKKQGCEVIVISPVPWTPFPIKYLSQKWRKYSEIPKKEILDGIEIYYPRYLTFPRALFFTSSGKRMHWGIKKIVAKIYKNFKFDIIHAHVALPDGYAGMMLAKKYKKPLIVTIHGQDFYQTIYKNKKCKKNIEKVINFSKKTIVVSNQLKKIGEKKLKIESAKLVVVPNGIDLNDIHPQNENDFSDKYQNKKIILSVSYLIKRKGVDYNIKAIAKLIDKYPDIICLVIGDGEERKNLEELVQKMNLKKYVKFLGQLPHDEAMEYISICDIFSLPSWDEGFGIVYIEAMAHGKPAIACQGQGIEDVIKDKETGILVEPKNVNNLTKVIDFLLLNPKEAKEIGEMGQKIVLENYTWSQVVEKIINIYKNIL